MAQKISALVGLGLALLVIALLSVLIFMFAVGLVLALEEVLLGPATTAGIPGSRLLSAAADKESTRVRLALFFSLLAYLSLTLAVFIEARRRGKSAWRDLVAWHPWSFRHGDRRVYGIAVLALAYGFLADLALRHFYPPSESWMTMPRDPTAALALGFVAVVCAPVAEELLFRGWMYTDLRRHFGLATALVVPAAVFAWLHYEATHLYALAVFPIGLALGAIREVAGSVKPAIVFHALNNFLATALGFLDVG